MCFSAAFDQRHGQIVRTERALPLSQGRVFDILHVILERSVVDEDIESPELIDGALDDSRAEGRLL